MNDVKRVPGCDVRRLRRPVGTVARVGSMVLAVCLLVPATMARAAPEAIPAERIADAVAQLDGLAQTIMSETGIPGLAVAVVHNGETLFAGGYGVRERGKDDAIDVDTVFQIASLSKSISATVVAHEIGDGPLGWDSPVRHSLPWLRLHDGWVSDHVTIADLFSHRSGLPDHAGDDLEDLGFDRRQILERLRHMPLQGFRDSYAYTNYGLTAAAEAVAAASGLDWADLATATIYRPLGMASTSSRFEDFIDHDNRAVGHALINGVFMPEKLRIPDPQAPAGGVSSTVSDMARWMVMVLSQGRFEGRVIVDAAALLPAITPQAISRHPATADDIAGFYGYGFGVAIRPSGRTMVSHSGAFVLGAATNYMLLPSEKIGIVALSNGAPVGAVEALTAQFMDLVQYGAVQRDWLAGYRRLFAPLTAPIGALVGKEHPQNPAPSAPLQALTGSYHSDYFGVATIEIHDSAPVLMLGPDAQAFALEHWDGNRFFFPVFNESMPYGSISSLTFQMADSDRAGSMVVEFLNENGLAQFDRLED